MFFHYQYFNIYQVISFLPYFHYNLVFDSRKVKNIVPDYPHPRIIQTAYSNLHPINISIFQYFLPTITLSEFLCYGKSFSTVGTITDCKVY